MSPRPQGPCVSLLTSNRVAATRLCKKKNFNLGLRNWIALAFASIALLGGHMEVCDYRDSIGMSLPVATLETVMRPLSERVRPKAGKQFVRFASVNDTHPDTLRAPPVVTLFQDLTFSNPGVWKSWRDFPTRFPVWTDEPPVSSPFSFSVIFLCGILFGFHYVGAGWPHSFMGTSWLLLTLAALPICAHWSERCAVTRYLHCHPKDPLLVRSTTRVRICTVQSRTLCRGYLVFCLLAISLAWLLAPWDPGVSSQVSFTKTVQYWRPAAVMGSMRIGEASNPGPDFVVSTLNVASLSMHQDEVQVASHSPTIRVFTETCLTQQILPTIQRKARQVQKFVVPSCICAPRKLASRSDSQTRGESGGVLLCSDLPARQGNVPMDQTAWLSTRIVEAIVSISSNLVIRVVGFYGYSKRYPGHIERTNQLLTRVLDYVEKSTIPCIFVGDLNCDLQDLSVWKILQDRGWMDSAILQKSKDGIDPLPTWSSYSRIDFILLPPALVPFFRMYSNSPDTVSDHSEIAVTLAVAQEQVHRHVWKPCRDMRSFLEADGWHSEDFQGIDWSRFHQEVSAGNVEGAYKSFCIAFESMLAKARSRLFLDIPLQQFQGRANPKIVCKPIHAPLVKKPRNGEATTPVDDAPMVFRQRIRQARRIHSLRCQLQHCLQRDTDHARAPLEAARNTWESVLRSTGFPPNFCTFAKSELGLILPRTLYPEDLPLIQVLEDLMKSQLTSWQWKYSKTKKHRHLNFLLSDWQKGGKVHFATIRPSPKPEIALLEVPFPMEVMRHRHSKTGPVVLTCLSPIPEGVAFVQFSDQRRSIVRKDPPHIWIDAPLSASQAKIKVLLLKPTGALEDIHSTTIEYWSQFWKSDDTADVEVVKEILSDFQLIPPFTPTISLSDVQRALRKIQVDKARGPDSWSPWDLKCMPHPFQIALTSLFNLFIEQAQWPLALTNATVAMLSKQDGVFQIEQTRPITILSMVYRVWSRVIAYKFLYHVKDLLPEAIQGNRPGSAAKWVASYVQCQVEVALYQGLEYSRLFPHFLAYLHKSQTRIMPSLTNCSGGLGCMLTCRTQSFLLLECRKAVPLRFIACSN